MRPGELCPLRRSLQLSDGDGAGAVGRALHHDGSATPESIASPRGELISSWASRATEPNKFHLPHASSPIGRRDLRLHDRRKPHQVFSADGELPTMWTDLRRPLASPWTAMASSASARAGERALTRISLMDKRGAVVARWDSLSAMGAGWCPCASTWRRLARAAGPYVPIGDESSSAYVSSSLEDDLVGFPRRGAAYLDGTDGPGSRRGRTSAASSTATGG